jgi:NADP-dependent 3-hydroxy acid dehydrogenase YdfG
MKKLQKVVVALTVVGPFGYIIHKTPADFSLSTSRNPPPYSNKDKVVWIVGASSGIGSSLAKDFLKDGAKVIISARRENLLKDVITELKNEDEEAKNSQETKTENPVMSFISSVLSSESMKTEKFNYQENSMILPLDITSFDDHSKAVKKILNEYGRIDIVVLNAGISQRNFVNDTPLDITEKIIKTNFLSYVSLTKQVLPTMMSQNSGKVSVNLLLLLFFHLSTIILFFLLHFDSQIVVMSSLAGLISLPIQTTYCASKFALVRNLILFGQCLVELLFYLAWFL